MTQPPDATQPVNPIPPPPQAAPAPPAPPAPSAPSAPQQPAPPGSSAAPASILLAVGIVLLTVVSLAVKENGRRGYSDWTAWAVFATVVAAVHLAPLALRGNPTRTWDVAAIATGGLVLYWVAVVLPFISDNVSFAATAAVALAVAHCWLLPGRR